MQTKREHKILEHLERKIPPSYTVIVKWTRNFHVVISWRGLWHAWVFWIYARDTFTFTTKALHTQKPTPMHSFFSIIAKTVSVRVVYPTLLSERISPAKFHRYIIIIIHSSDHVVFMSQRVCRSAQARGLFFFLGSLLLRVCVCVFVFATLCIESRTDSISTCDA